MRDIEPRFFQSIQFSARDGRSVEPLMEKLAAQLQSQSSPCRIEINDRHFSWRDDALGQEPAIVRSDEEKIECYLTSWWPDDEDYARAVREFDEVESVLAFDSIAVRLDEMRSLREDRCREKAPFPLWTMRYRGLRDARERSPQELAVLAVMEKIIHRGRLTVVSGWLERNLEGSYEVALAHQIQSVLIELVKQGRLGEDTSFAVELGAGCDAVEDEADLSRVAALALEDLVELGKQVGALYDEANPFAGIHLTDTAGHADAVLRWIDDADPLGDGEVRISSLSWSAEEIEFPFISVREPARVVPDLGRLEFLLSYIFRFPHFRPRQAEALMRGIQRRDTIVLLPTGSGKSVVFQLLSLITPGMSFIVCPILSLMDDQVENLRDRGIDRVVGINSELSAKERSRVEYLLGVGQYLMAYVTPERFQNMRFLERVQRYARHNVISTIAIDEAHCVSEWGHDFRPAYLGLAETCRDVCRTGDVAPPLLALTGTASMSVLTDMRHDLGIADPASIIRPPSFDRPEIHFRVLRVPSDGKIGALDYVVRTLLPRDFGSAARGLYGDRTVRDEEVGCGIVFCPHSSGPYGLMNSAKAIEHGHLGVWDHLNRVLPDRCGRYAGKPPKALGMGRAQWGKFKREQARRFKNDELAVMVTTKAFGMGIDKPNVRWVAHFGIPSSLEAYYQEVGRAARDGKFACAYLILSNDFPELNQRMLDPSRSSVDVLESLEGKKERYKGDDVSRIMHFHTSSFGGVGQELQCAQRVLDGCIPERWAEGRWRIPFCENGAGEDDEINGRTAREKAIYRFKLLGVFQSYTMEYEGVGGDGFFVVQPAPLKGKDLRDSIVERYLDYISSYQSDRAYVDHAAASLSRAVDGIADDRQFIMAVLRHLLSTFTYKVLEEGRRRAILTMLETAERAFAAGDVDAVDDVFRQELLAYLSTEDEGQLDVLDVLANATDTELLLKVMERYVADDAVGNMIGQSLRLLEDYPQHYGLHYLLAMGYLLRGEAEQGLRSARAMVDFGVESYGVAREDTCTRLMAFLKTDMATSVSAEALHPIVQLLASVLGKSERKVLAPLRFEQAAMLKKIYRMHDIATLATRGRL